MRQRGILTAPAAQRRFQRRVCELVMRACQTRCAVCRIRHNPLLDAAHILPDRDERGRPEVPNGLALCQIHPVRHECHILGVAPDRVIHIRHDILAEHDGPMLGPGLKDMNGERLSVPRNALLHPNTDYLAERFERFRAA